MSRTITSLVALCAAMAASAPSLAADYGEWTDQADTGGFRDGYPTEPKDWAGLGDQDDPLYFEFGARYWYAWGGQDFSSGGGTLSESDNAHIGELHLRIEDHSSNVWATALAAYSVKIDGSFTAPFGGGTIADGHVAYTGADIGWDTWGDNNGSGFGPLVGYMYWQDAPDTGRFNFTTATSASDITYDPITGQTFLPGNSAPNHVDTHLLRLGVGGKVKLGEQFDITGNIAAVPYAKVSGSVGIDDPIFDTSVYGGPAQLPYTGAAIGNIASIRSSATSIDGWGYGAQAEGWIGFHPSENLVFRLGARAWYLQGTVDATYSRATIGNPTDSDADGVYDTDPTFVNTGLIDTNNPFRMFRYGVLAEMTYAF